MYLVKKILNLMIYQKIRLLDENLCRFSSSIATSIPDKLISFELDLNKSLKKLIYNPPIHYIYSPLDYAAEMHYNFNQKYCKTTKRILFVGMNPGPWGMCQTGIPFGEINAVKHWLKINGKVNKPEIECPNRRVTGLSCTISEISGQRIWGLFRNICSIPENLFKIAYVYNYCPLAFLNQSGVNVTPAEIEGATQGQLEQLCDTALFNIVQLLQVEIIVGVGRYVEKRSLKIVKDNQLKVKVVYLIHPSPRVPNNEDWIFKAEQILNNHGILSYFRKE